MTTVACRCFLVAAMLWCIGSAALAVTAPTVSPVSGTFMGAQHVTMSAPAGQIFYTLDGSMPTNQSIPYSAGGFQVSSPTQVNAVAYVSGATPPYSPVTTKCYDVDAALAPILQSGLILRLRGGLGPVTSPGNPAPIHTWLDLSGAQNDATMSTASHQPGLFLQAGQSPAAHFNGAGQYMSLPSGFATFSGATIFAVIQPGSIASAPILDLGQGATGNNVLVQLGSSGIAQWGTFAGTSGTYANSANATLTDRYQIVEAVHTAGAPNASATVLLTGTAGPTNSAMNNIPSVGNRTSNFLGLRSGGTGNPYCGRILELLFYNTSLNATQRTAIRQLLISRYGLGDASIPAPFFMVPGGTLPGPTLIAIGPGMPGGCIRYTRDGSTPSLSSQPLTGPILVSYSQTIKAINVVNGIASTVSSASYTLDVVNWPAPNAVPTPTLDFQLQLPSNATAQP